MNGDKHKNRYKNNDEWIQQELESYKKLPSVAKKDPADYKKLPTCKKHGIKRKKSDPEYEEISSSSNNNYVAIDVFSKVLPPKHVNLDLFTVSDHDYSRIDTSIFAEEVR